MEEATTEKLTGLTVFVLKMIAVCSMLIDHFGATVVERYIDANMLWDGNWYIIYRTLRCIGRLAFPIYCFFIVEGFKYTRSRPKYAIRLLAFAFISEVPFDMAFQKSFFDMSYNNVFFTLFLGLLTIWAIDEVCKRISGNNAALPTSDEFSRSRGDARLENCQTVGQEGIRAGDGESSSAARTNGPQQGIDCRQDPRINMDTRTKALTILATIGIAAVGTALGFVLNTDYYGGGVLTILAIYLTRNKKKPLSMAIGVCVCA
ncbi:MAG: hypothetical protein IIZ61_03265, partial [Lachnospiraceae bacterium]|nr:hypothetical protein [Lachnospiraceae bacterium]